MSRDLTIELQSIRDGKASIEHQLDIHVNDLFGVQDNLQLSLEDVLEGLKYVMNYRIKGGRLPNLDYEIMKRLCEGLLFNMRKSEGGLLKRKLTYEANQAFILFVEEFRQTVGEKNISDLYNSLKFHKRCRKDADPDVKQAAVAIIYMLTTWFSQFSDWHELVKEDDQDDVEKVIKEFTDSIKKPSMPPLQSAALPPPSLYFDRDVTRLLKMFRISLNDGLSSTSIPSLLEHYGHNQLPEPPKPSILMMIINQLKDFIVVMLLVFSVVTGAKQDFKGMGVLLFVVVLNTLIGFIQEFKANKALEALQKLTVPKARVIRDGEQSIIDSNQLVPGDIVILEEGDSVPADLRIVESSNLELIESILTGESVPTSKNIKKIMTKTRNLPLGDCKGNAFMSTIVAKGRGKGLVIGKISAAITSVPRMRTPIQKKLSKLGIWLVNNAYRRETVSVVPEGLVAVTTVTMAIGVIRMAARCAIVRTLPAVETLGSVTVICSDKTGTLTEGKMGPCELWTADNSIYSFTEPTSLDPNKGGIIFHSLECPQKGGFSKSYWENNHNFLKVHEKPFDSERKLMSVVYKINKDSSSSSPSQKKEENKNKFLVLAKGAPEELLRKCTHYMAEIKSSNNNNAEIFDAISEDNYSSPLTEEFVDLISDQSSRMASKEGKDEENNLIFIGLIGLIDPPKKAVKESIRICKLAGIKVIMITELDLLSDEAISELNPFPTVFARVSPDNKLKIVKALQNLKNIVAMTGDGVNDAPAIKAADVGVAMGLSGTEITKQAADIILSNDDFSTIVAAVEEGRRVFDNILKFIVYLLSCNSAEIIIMLICAVINLDLPFTTIMILWANIIVEPVEKDIMKRKPRNPNAGVLDLYATTILITQSFVMALLSFGVFIIALSPIEHIELADARSLAFATLTSMQLIQGFFSRTLYESVFKTGFFTNKWMIVSVVGSFIALLLGIYVPGLREWLDLTPVPAFGWAKIAICVIIQLIISELGKFIGRMYRDKKK
ncbi:14714_t:CDS:10 [Entrophospora sp. SA101]|nr:14714_t:CDS:10 [Entrophospora sp. SA101]